jgi:hypothetical protein
MPILDLRVRSHAAHARAVARPDRSLLPATATAGQRWRFHRDLVIVVAHRQGISQRLLGDVFVLQRSTIRRILDKFTALVTSPSAPPSRTPAPLQPPSLPPGATSTQRWKARRDLVIAVAHRNGLSQHLLAEVFGLARSRIREIIKKY